MSNIGIKTSENLLHLQKSYLCALNSHSKNAFMQTYCFELSDAALHDISMLIGWLFTILVFLIFMPFLARYLDTKKMDAPPPSEQKKTENTNGVQPNNNGLR